MIIQVCIGNMLFSQTSETVRSDRPGLSNSPFTVGKNVIQLQPGLTFVRATSFNTFGSELVVRYGLAEKHELDVFSAWSTDFSNAPTSSFDFTGLSYRYNITDSKDWRPSMAFQLDYGNKSVGTLNQGRLMQRFLITSQLNDNFALTSNLGFRQTFSYSTPVVGEETEYMLYHTLNLSYGYKRFGCYFEWLNTYLLEESALNGGASFLINNNVQLDVFGGLLRDAEFQVSPFVSGGITLRLPEKN